jgi:hypothetical protein
MRKIITILLISFASQVFGSKISDAYDALSIFDYFKAKQLFYKSLKKYPSESSFGLAHIYYKTDNPFSNIDSAAKYIAKCKTNFKDTISYSLFHINSESINSLAFNIGNKGYEKYGNLNSVESYNFFLSHFYFSDSTLLIQSYLKRDGIQLSNALASQSSDSVTKFLLQYPQSSLYQKAKKLFYDYEYTEQTKGKSIYEYERFLKHYASNPNITFAENNLFNLVKTLHSNDSVYRFIKNYSTDLTSEAAWKLLYSLSVKSYSKEELTDFLKKYPDYPFNESVLKEIELSQYVLIALKKDDDKYGYIDTLGNWIIKPQFDDATIFSEGFAAVYKNDSCFYINKEGQQVTTNYFEEAENYKNGVAVAKNGNQYFLINRSGQYISKGYQDINKRSDDLYVCKLGNLYGAINGKGETVIPFTYAKLGNFKNGFAYYMSVKYGLVDLYNNTLQAQWDWISDVDTNSIVIVKKKNQFGLMNTQEQIILPTEYDYISLAQNDIYLVVKNNLYGFYNVKEKCFVTSIGYDYDPAFLPSYYTNGKYFKLIQDNEVALVNANGKYSINFGSYSNLYFAKCDILRIQKKNKYGFVDRKLKPVTTIEFDDAHDFKNDVAIVTKKETSYLINTQGKSIYSIKNGEIIDDLSGSFYKISFNELTGVINSKGEVILNAEFKSIEQLKGTLFYCEKVGERFLYNSNTKILKKL